MSMMTTQPILLTADPSSPMGAFWRFRYGQYIPDDVESQLQAAPAVRQVPRPATFPPEYYFDMDSQLRNVRPNVAQTYTQKFELLESVVFQDHHGTWGTILADSSFTFTRRALWIFWRFWGENRLYRTAAFVQNYPLLAATLRSFYDEFPIFEKGSPERERGVISDSPQRDFFQSFSGMDPGSTLDLPEINNSEFPVSNELKDEILAKLRRISKQLLSPANGQLSAEETFGTCAWMESRDRQSLETIWQHRAETSDILRVRQNEQIPVQVPHVISTASFPREFYANLVRERERIREIYAGTYSPSLSARQAAALRAAVEAFETLLDTHTNYDSVYRPGEGSGF
ncbi:hypothetical protein BJ508DRAFT_313054 [Ascobolus immersus RN42]|uniref:Uncharacterized protein n=1 Tax=Ascobolus immersus RN42 TaxID=1160509 RepID=A0A3N4HQA2_ASCIM|nr:hypothetical protein BJ508DRAFT_313054 [Ascobolus immersus RN42]